MGRIVERSPSQVSPIPMLDTAVRLRPKSPAMPDRLARARGRLMAAMPKIYPEQALLIPESYRQTRGEPMVLRRAKALE